MSAMTEIMESIDVDENLEKSKKKVSNALVVDPTNTLLKRLEAGLDNAISQKDESRRAAILNTLMQYESVRKLLKEEGQE
jgi:hypothetical protein